MRATNVEPISGLPGRNPFAGIDDKYLPMVVQNQRKDSPQQMLADSDPFLVGGPGRVSRSGAHEHSRRPSASSPEAIASITISKAREKLIAEVGHEIAMVADTKYHIFKLKQQRVEDEKRQKLAKTRRALLASREREQTLEKRNSVTPSRKINPKPFIAKTPPIVKRRPVTNSQSVPQKLPSYLRATKASTAAYKAKQAPEEEVQEKPKPKRQTPTVVSGRLSQPQLRGQKASLSKSQRASHIKSVAHRKAKSKILHQGKAHDLLTRARRASLSTLADENLEQWIEDKLKMRVNMAMLRDEFETKYENIADIGLHRIKEDARIHTEELKGKTEKLLAKKRLRMNEDLRISEMQVHNWKRSRKWLMIYYLTVPVELLVKQAKCTFTNKVYILRKLARTAFRLKLWVHQWKKRHARSHVRRFMVDMMQIKSVPKRVYRFRVSCLLIRRSAIKLQKISKKYIACHKAKVVAMVNLAVRLEREHREIALRANRGEMDTEWNAVTEKAASFLESDIRRREGQRRKALNSIVDSYLFKKRSEHVRRNFPTWKEAMMVWETSKKGFDTDDVKKILKDTSEMSLKRQANKRDDKDRPNFPHFYPDRIMRKEMATNPKMFGADL